MADEAEAGSAQTGSGVPAEGAAEAAPAAEAAAGETTYAAPKAARAVFASPPTDSDSVESLQAQVKDLTAQLSSLNGKLVRSFERVADLEDDYSEVKSRLLSSQTKISDLEKERSEHLAALNTGLLVEKSHVSSEMQRMMDKVLEESKQRGKAESDKKQIEEELEQLSASLFSEANRMVAVEKLARARAEEKSGSMEQSLKDTEAIMLEQQKVLASLQRQIEELQQGGLSTDAASVKSGTDNVISIEALARSPSTRTTAVKSGHSSTDMQVLLNTQPFQEFIAFVAHLRKSRLSLRHFYSFPVPGQPTQPTTPTQTVPRTTSPGPFSALAVAAGGGGSSTSLNPFQAAGVSRHRDYPSLPSSADDLVKIGSQLFLPFLKRAQEEDSDPCLRFDFAPGLNWLSRRQANTAMVEGALVIEPIFPGGIVPDADEVRAQTAHLSPAACAMCGMPVVNVPLSAPQDAADSSQGSRSTSWATSFSAAGSAASSMLEAAGVSRQKGDDATSQDKTRSSLFSSLRMGTSTPRPDGTSGSIAQRLPSFGLAPGADEANDARVTFLAPIPTHIFRLSESGSSRYLVCPHHCLERLRAAYAFWGWVRSLERSIVLEGKCPWEEDPTYGGFAAPPSSKTPVAGRPAQVTKALPPSPEKAPIAIEALEAQAAAEAGATAEAKEETKEQAEEPAADADKSAGKEDGSEALGKGTPPPLPARRRPVTPAAPVAHISRSIIPARGGDDLNWAEKLWQEVIAHKDNMHRARLALRSEDSL